MFLQVTHHHLLILTLTKIPWQRFTFLILHNPGKRGKVQIRQSRKSIAAINEEIHNGQDGLEDTVKKQEAAIGFEPMNRGFADLCLSHLATPPEHKKIRIPGRPSDPIFFERETGFEPATLTLAR